MDSRTSTFTILHDQKLEELDTTEAEIDYLLDAFDFIKGQDVDGWRAKYTPPPPPPPKKVKRMRCSPMQVPPPERRFCRSCKSSDIFDDAAQGRVVCIACGLIQGIFMSNQATYTCVRGVIAWGSKYVVHHYSRGEYFATVLRGLIGETTPQLLPDHESCLRRAIAEYGPAVPDARRLKQIIRKNKLPNVLNLHVEALLSRFVPSHTCLQIPHYILSELKRRHRIVDFYWAHGYAIPKRSVFFSTKFLFVQFCADMDCMQYVKRDTYPRSTRAVRNLLKYYIPIAEKNQWRYLREYNQRDGSFVVEDSRTEGVGC